MNIPVITDPSERAYVAGRMSDLADKMNMDRPRLAAYAETLSANLRRGLINIPVDRDAEELEKMVREALEEIRGRVRHS